jgi:DNA-binding MarR family transcriptional regulator
MFLPPHFSQLPAMQRADPTGLITCPQPCNVRYAPTYSLDSRPMSRYAASWEFSGNNFDFLLQYEFENQILSALGYDMQWRWMTYLLRFLPPARNLLPPERESVWQIKPSATGLRPMFKALDTQSRRLLDSYPAIFLACHRQHVRDDENGKIVTEHQASVLDHLNWERAVMLSRLAEHMGMSRSTMSITVKRLVRDGYVARTRNKDDARYIDLRLTRAGTRVKEQKASARAAAQQTEIQH